MDPRPPAKLALVQPAGAKTIDREAERVRLVGRVKSMMIALEQKATERDNGRLTPLSPSELQAYSSLADRLAKLVGAYAPTQIEATVRPGEVTPAVAREKAAEFFNKEITHADPEGEDSEGGSSSLLAN